MGAHERGITMKETRELVESLMQHSKQCVYDYIKKGSRGVDEMLANALVTRHVLLVGEIAMLTEEPSPKRKDPKRLIKVPQVLETYLQALIQASPSDSVPLSQESIMLTPQPELSQLSNATLDTFRNNGGTMTPTVQSAAFLTLGKLCLVNEALSKKFIGVFVNQLQKSTNEVVKTNILAILADLCVEYSGSVDKYAVVMARCMGDSSVLVRHTALVLLTQLLAEGFLKMKPILVFSFLVSLADENKSVATFAESALVRVLLPKQPQMFFNHFIELLFVLNDYQGHSDYNKNPLHSAIYSLSDQSRFRQRLWIYKVMLNNMTQYQIYKLHQKLHTEVLAFCSEDGEVDFPSPSQTSHINCLEAPGSNVLTDVLAVLTSKQMKLTAKAPQAGSAPEDDSPAALSELNKKLYAEMLQKHIELSVIPVLVDLKRYLRRNKSHLMRYLSGYLQVIMREYKNEIQNMLAADPQLAVELEYDIRQQQKKRARDQMTLDRRQSLPGLDSHAIMDGPLSPELDLHDARRESEGSHGDLTPLSGTASPAVKLRRSSLEDDFGDDPSRVLFKTEA
eukprot:NODE_912_length_1994_cov_108.230893_g864_i0.p1 GENE.NODE_912_length_1994_cov_108.230893_g864_i0~~NODE_912_length_1994_cov_108.230893_g864_i0.p1  ORF type:complete len:607 (-),score=138.39 NODE_912_length_1994_cov_108.230893_g864_i0:172-1866(-)